MLPSALSESFEAMGNLHTPLLRIGIQSDSGAEYVHFAPMRTTRVAHDTPFSTSWIELVSTDGAGQIS